MASSSALGVPLKPDWDQAWSDFAGWRVNYDTVLLALCTRLTAPEAPWSSDRAPGFRRRPLFIQQAGPPFITAGATSPKIPTQVGDKMFLACLGDNVSAAAGASLRCS